MKQLYIVADNAFSISASDELAAWDFLKPRFAPFISDSDASPLIDIDITSAPLDSPEAELIYEPENEGIELVSARAWRGLDGSLILDFRPIEEQVIRMRMILTTDYRHAEITLSPEGDENDPFFLTHAIMIAYMLSTAATGTLLIHSSSVLYDGKAYMFQGKSGTGKSTHARMWVENIEGATLLNDDNPLIRFSGDGIATAYGSPWSGKTDCYLDKSAPIGAMVRIVRASENELVQLKPLQAYASLTTSIFYLPFLSERLRAVRHDMIERLVGTVPCYEMRCRPDADAARTCLSNLT